MIMMKMKSSKLQQGIFFIGSTELEMRTSRACKRAAYSKVLEEQQPVGRADGQPHAQPAALCQAPASASALMPRHQPAHTTVRRPLTGTGYSAQQVQLSQTLATIGAAVSRK